MRLISYKLGKHYEKAQQALADLDTEFLSVDDFINQQIKTLLAKQQEWAKEKEDYKKNKPVTTHMLRTRDVSCVTRPPLI